MKRSERGSAMMVVLIATLILLPLALTLAVMVMARLRQAVDYRDTIRQEAAARAGLEEARLRVAQRDFSLGPGEAVSFETKELAGLDAAVRVSREPDVVLSLDGRVAGPLEEVDLDLTSYDAEGRRVYLYRKLELYLVESKVRARPALAGCRLLGVLARRPDGVLVPIGTSAVRGFW